MLTVEQKKKFWSQVRKSAHKGGCWYWEGSHNSKYGVMLINKYQVSVHRISFALTNGPIDSKTFIKHSCGNVLCVNPAHLHKYTKITLNMPSHKSACAFELHCKRYNAKFPFKLTERRDRALAEFGVLSA